MAKNQYFGFPNKPSEKNLYFDLASESVNIHGFEIYYIKNELVNVDDFYGEDRIPNLDNATKIVVMLTNAREGVSGEAIFSKFGFQDKTTISFTFAIKEWYEKFGVSTRPNEGDIMYVPNWNEWGASDFYKLTYVDKQALGGYMPLGDKRTFTVEAEKWVYASEHLDTGIADIDLAEVTSSLDVEIAPDLINDAINDKVVATALTNTFVDFSESNPFGNIVR